MNLSGTWKNTRESVMTIQTSGDSVAGTYQTGVGDETSRAPVALRGTIDGDLIGFIVIYPSKSGADNSLCAWAGRYFNDKDGERICTVWSLVRRSTSKEGEDGKLVRTESEDWNHVLTNADVFTRA